VDGALRWTCQPQRRKESGCTIQSVAACGTDAEKGAGRPWLGANLPMPLFCFRISDGLGSSIDLVDMVQESP